ncbi:Nucleoside-triphosphatase THEP1 [Gossypium australe]|uniref:Nucleoside-triphosphatase THEP1 n=1 Tax=Gossypium australe TaxID=47621 RepID=A0A5B6WYK7_9ROSI|nr:Nucleoside-triphosphatase THEP1 [Gossypium australe]
MALQEEEVEWRAPWMVLDEILYWCGDFDWVPLLGIWGAVGYAPLLALRQYRSKQFIPTTHGLAQYCERNNSEFGKKIEQLEEEKMQLGLDADVQKLEAEKLRKGKNKAEEDLDSLKTDCKKLQHVNKNCWSG